MRIGLDIEQFVRDPYGSGIQRVLQYLAITWPSGDVEPLFVVPVPNSPRTEFHLLNASEAGELLSIPFLDQGQARGSRDLRAEVELALVSLRLPVFTLGDVMAVVNAWMLPEVSYLPRVLDRFELFQRTMPALMIGYDTLPMTEPANYRFKPGTESNVSRYFRLLATADSVVCISAYARESIWSRLRRDRLLPCTVAHPGGDHVVSGGVPVDRDTSPNAVVRWCRVGTMEARKSPVEIADAFVSALDTGARAELVFVGGASASDAGINSRIRSLVSAGYPIKWIESASDSEVAQIIASADIFLSVGTEGYGIPVLEAIALGTPVLFSGIQPAADLMVGAGSLEIESGDLISTFREFSEGGKLQELVDQIDARQIPQWSDFSAHVAWAIKKAVG